MTSAARHARERRLWRCRRGAALVEFTLVTPLLLSLGLGVTEFGNMLQNYHVIDKGVRDAARYLAHRQVLSCPPTDPGWSDDVKRAKYLAMTGDYQSSPPDPPDPASLKLKYWKDYPTVTVTVSCVDNSSGTWNGEASIPIITVAASVPYSGFGLLAALGLPSITLGTQHEELNLPD